VDPGASPRGRRVLAVYFAGFLLFVYVPSAIALIVSFGSDPLASSFGDWTLRWYRAVLDEPALRHALAAGLEVALAVAAIDVVVAVLLGFALARRRTAGPGMLRRAVFAMGLAPLALPPVTYGVAFLVYARRGPHPVPFGLYLVAPAHAALFLPIAVLIVVPPIAAVGRDLFETAEDLGADGLVLLRRLVLPIVARPIALAFLLVAVFSFNEPAVAPMLIDKNPTFAAWLWDYARLSSNAPFASALSALGTALAVVVALVLRLALAGREASLTRLRQRRR
jgi:ABC-type spermidine/putrescine transport system permease subunit II